MSASGQFFMSADTLGPTRHSSSDDAQCLRVSSGRPETQFVGQCPKPVEVKVGHDALPNSGSPLEAWWRRASFWLVQDCLNGAPSSLRLSGSRTPINCYS